MIRATEEENLEKGKKGIRYAVEGLPFSTGFVSVSLVEKAILE